MFYMEKTVDLAGEGRKDGHTAGGARTAASWQSVSLIRLGTGLVRAVLHIFCCILMIITC